MYVKATRSLSSNMKKFRLSLRALLAFTAIACLWFGKASIDARRQRAAVDWVESNGGLVFYDWSYDQHGAPKPVGSQKPFWPKWLMRAIGEDYFQTAASVMFARNADVRDISMLRSLPDLQHVVLTDNKVEDLTPLQDLQLKSLYLARNNVTDLSPLSQMNSLEQLFVDDNGITDISPISQLTSLQSLFAKQNTIVDIHPLSELRKLQFLDLSDNQIVDCSPLMDLPPMQSLNLMGNPIGRERLKPLRTRQPLMRGSDWFQGW
jgi:hypothetical protein